MRSNAGPEKIDLLGVEDEKLDRIFKYMERRCKEESEQKNPGWEERILRLADTCLEIERARQLRRTL